MLETRENFLEMFSDDQKAVLFIEKYFKSKKAFNFD